MMVFRHSSSVHLNSVLNKFSVYKNAVSGHILRKFFSWRSLSTIQRWWRWKYCGGRKPFVGTLRPVFAGCQSNSPLFRRGLSNYVGGPPTCDKAYSITVSNVSYHNRLIQKTIGKPKYSGPLSFIKFDRHTSQNESSQADLNLINTYFSSGGNESDRLQNFGCPVDLPSVSGSRTPLPHAKKTVKNTDPHKNIDVYPEVSNSDDSGVKQNSPPLHCNSKSKSKVRSLTKTEQKNVIKNEKNSQISAEDTLIINPFQPDSRIILFFKNKNVHAIGPSNFDCLTMAYQYLTNLNKNANKKNRPGRMHFVTFEKVFLSNEFKTSYNSRQSGKEITDLTSVILKEQECCSLEDRSNKFWIPLYKDHVASSDKQSKCPAGAAKHCSTEDKNDTFVTKIPIKKDQLIDESVVPNKSILDIINSIDRSTVIIQKDLYITNRILQKIKDEKKIENNNKKIDTKGSVAEESVLVFIIKPETKINDLLGDNESSDLFEGEKIESEASDITPSNVQENKKEILLHFSTSGSPVFKGVPTTDLIKKAAAIIEKEKYHQKKMSENQKEEKPEVNELKKEIPIKRPMPVKPSETEIKDNFPGDKYSCPVLDSDYKMLSGDPLILLNISHDSMNSHWQDSLDYTRDCDRNVNFNFYDFNTLHDTKLSNESCSNLDSQSQVIKDQIIRDETDCLKDFKNFKFTINNSTKNNASGQGIINKGNDLTNKKTDFGDSFSVDKFDRTKGSQDKKGEGLSKSNSVTSPGLSQKISNPKNKSSDHSVKTSITVNKSNNMTDINVSEKETFTDGRVPVSFSTETHFQVFGSNSSIQKEMTEFEKMKGTLLSQMVPKESNKNLEKKISKDLKTFFKKNDIPIRPLKIESITPKDNPRHVPQDPEISKALSTNKTLTPETNKTKQESIRKQKEGRKDRLHHRRGARKDQIKTAKSLTSNKPKPIAGKVKKDNTINLTTDSIGEDKTKSVTFGDNYVSLLEGPSLKKHKKTQKGIMENKCLSKRDKKILREILKGNKNKSIKIHRGHKVKSMSVHTNSPTMGKQSGQDSKSRNFNKKGKDSSPGETAPPEVKAKDSLPTKTHSPGVEEEKSTLKSVEVDTSSHSTSSAEVGKRSNTSMDSSTSHKNSKVNSKESSKGKNENLDITKSKTEKPKTLTKSSPQDSTSMVDGNLKSFNKYTSKISGTLQNVNKSKKNSETKVSPKMSVNDTKYSYRKQGSIEDHKNYQQSSLGSTGKVNSEQTPYYPPDTTKQHKGTAKDPKLKTPEKAVHNNNKLQENKSSQITVIESKTPENSEKNHKEIFKNKLLENIKTKLEQKHSINFRARKINIIQPVSGTESLINKNLTKKPISKISGSTPKLKQKVNKQSLLKKSSKHSPKTSVKTTHKPLLKEVSPKRVSRVPNENPQIKSSGVQYPKMNALKDSTKVKSSDTKVMKPKGKTTIEQKELDNQTKNKIGSGKQESQVQEATNASTKTTYKSTFDGKKLTADNSNVNMDLKQLKTNKNTEKSQNEIREPAILKDNSSETIPTTEVVKPSEPTPQKKISESSTKAKVPFFRLLIDIDKMTKESKPTFNLKNCRICSLTAEKIKHFPLLNAKKTKEFNEPFSVIKVCPSKDPLLEKELSLVPSVTKILNVTLANESKQVIKNWWKEMQKDLGENGFRSFYKDEMSSGIQFHNLIQDHLLWGGDKDAAPSSLCFKSLNNILKDVKDLSVINSHVLHKPLAYRGVLDCVATYKKKPVVIEWKRLNHKVKLSTASLDTAFQQLSAYIGAVNYDSNYKLQVREGVLVLAYDDGSEADLYSLKEEDCEKFWKMWLERLQKYQIHIQMKKSKQ